MHLVLLQLVGGITERSDAGGGTSSLLDLVGAWRSHGHSVHLITANPEFFRAYFGGAARVDEVPYSDRSASGFLVQFARQLVENPRMQAARLEEQLRSCRRECGDGPRVVIGTSPSLPDLVGLLRARSVLGAPSIAYVYHVVPPPWWHARARGHPGRNALAWLLAAFTLALVKLTGLTPAFCQESNLARGGWRFPGPVVYTYGFAEPSGPGGAPPMAGRPLLACSISRIMPSKGIADLIRAWQLVVREHPTAQLLIAGPVHSPVYQARLSRLVARLRLSNSVQFLGRISEVRKVELLGQARAFLSASYEEGWSYSVMEAVCSGAVPVVYDLAAYDHLKESVLRVPPGDIRGLASATARVLRGETPVSDAFRATLRETYSLENVAKRQLAQFEAL